MPENSVWLLGLPGDEEMLISLTDTQKAAEVTQQ